jgi:hypothetical protein
VLLPTGTGSHFGFHRLFGAYLVNRYSEQVYGISSSVIVRDDDQTKSFVGAEQLIQGLRLTKNTKSVQNEIGFSNRTH